jgi:hypothetical protein
METEGIRNEIKSYLGVLEKGKLTEIDLDSIGNCLREALGLLKTQQSRLNELNVLRTDIASEVISLVKANHALTNATMLADSEQLSKQLQARTAAELIEVRRRARAEFSKLRRQDGLPRRTNSASSYQTLAAEYRVER